MFEVYCATSPSGKRYVGVTARGEKLRWSEHAQAARSGSPLPLHRAIRKYGARAFQRTLLERMSTEAGAHHAERLWIAELGTYGRGGYNSTAGGEGTLGRVLSAESRARISVAHTGRVRSAEARANMSAGRKGLVPTLETKAKMSAAQTARRRAPVSADFRARMAALWTPERRAIMSATQLRVWADRKKNT